MKQRGRKSAESLAFAGVSVLADRRPPPPEDLNEFQSQLWRAIVDIRPVDYFRSDTFELLRAYCKHAWHGRMIDALIADRMGSSDPEQRAELGTLLKERRAETHEMVAIARAMRITQQAQMHPRTAARRIDKPTAGPWEAK